MFSDKLIIGEQWSSQLIFPSVSQEFRPQRAAPRSPQAAFTLSWLGFWKGEAAQYFWQLTVSNISDFEAQPLNLLPDQVQMSPLTLLGDLPGPFRLFLTLGALWTKLPEVTVWEPVPHQQHPWAPAITLLLPTLGGTHYPPQVLPPTQGKSWGGPRAERHLHITDWSSHAAKGTCTSVHSHKIINHVNWSHWRTSYFLFTAWKRP